MSKQQSKDELVNILHRFKEPVKFREIHAALNHVYPERTLRRWLAELCKQDIIKKTGAKKGTHYQIANNEDELVDSSFQQYLSTAARISIDYVQQPIFNRTPVTYNDDWIKSYIPNQSYFLPEKLRLELAKLGKSNLTNECAGTYARQIYNRLLIDLSYNSSRLEGNTYSLVDTEKLVMQGIGRQDKLDEERVMILNHKEAIRYLVEHAQEIEINSTSICTLHYLLADGLVLPEYSGHVRNQGVRIGVSTYHPLEDPRQLTIRLAEICKKASLILEPFEQSLFLLAHIAYLQAFIDVNKRVSRLSANIPLIQHNLVPLLFNDIDKAYYANAMIAIYELNDISALVDIYCFSYRRSCEQYKVTRQVIGFDEIRVRYRKIRREIIRHIIIQKLTENEINSYVQSQSRALIQKNNQADFIQTVYKDLKTISLSQVQGMGISRQQLEQWLALR
jgi:Fic family protein/predicted transcriptional regulator